MDGEAREKPKAASHSTKRRMNREHQAEQALEVVSFRYDLTRFFEQCLQIFFRTLLTMETNEVMEFFGSFGQLVPADEVVFRLADPFRRHLFHKGVFPE